ncbi:hypothetical protein ABWK22_01915 [Gottfriedia acidiceleris]|uniref:hypothetical protein n=1 Tax=Gottfriedia acidiceleris TaxID=371036 RepID=UPI003396228E
MTNPQYKKDIPFLRECLDKHSQLMRMHLRYNCIKQAKEQFKIIKPIFESLHNEGETMNYYTLEDFNNDSERFKK